MTETLSRRGLLRGIGHAAAFGALAAALPRYAKAAAADAAYSLSMIYQYDRTHAFNPDRFRDGHIPLLKSICGDSIERVELRHAEGPENAFIPPTFVVAAISIWIRDVDAFEARASEARSRIIADLRKVTDGSPSVQYDRTTLEQRAARAEVPLGSTCISTYLPMKEGARWDEKYYLETYMPKLLEAYGPRQVRRVEVCQGVAVPEGGPPHVLTTQHLYLANQEAFFATGRKVGMELAKEGRKYTDIEPIVAMLKVYAAG